QLVNMMVSAGDKPETATRSVADSRIRLDTEIPD
ncbi:MAG: TetR/AcrR family transcriptional regulator, partial [Saccharothrix sp.]|nr:TetR/AcrR family transcriptional regulator [Saccharothrix sp.]